MERNTVRGFSESRRLGWLLAAAVGCVFLLELTVELRNNEDSGEVREIGSGSKIAASELESKRFLILERKSREATRRAADELVAGKVKQFANKRRDLVRKIALKKGREVPPKIEEFFAALERGNWDEIESRWKDLAAKSGQYSGSTHDPAFNDFWPAVLDAYGVAEQAHLWPSEKLLEYGNSILDSLKPGMIYVGGTDAGRWIPELLNETGGGEGHVIITQNAFADSRYMEFMQTLYGERMNALTEDDSKRAFEEYVSDAKRRWEHDQRLPDEPKQLRPNEDVKMVDGKIQVSGQVAVMSINEKLLNMLMEKNPDVGFAMQQSFPFRSTYETASINGPVMELRAGEGENSLTSERAREAVDFWQRTASQLTGNDDSNNSKEVRSAYAHLAASQGMLLLERNFPEEAEQAFRSATQIAPGNPEAVMNFVNLLTSQGRQSEAIPVAQQAAIANPSNRALQELLINLQRGGNLPRN